MGLPDISIIIPCFNGSEYISEAIDTILSQKNVSLEIIVVDDGSTDGLRENSKITNHPLIKYKYQENQGVSVARNNGLKLCRGNFIVFFDADDKMSEGFLSSRLDILKNDPALKFVCGKVRNFNRNGISDKVSRGTSEDAVREILFYTPDVTTCPSNYMFRKEFLIQYDLCFNPDLSSTADKYFIIQCAKKGRGQFSTSFSDLLYRVTDTSMSHKLTPRLAEDNERFYSELLKNKLIPETIKSKSLFLGNMILFGAFLKVKNHTKALKFARRAFFLNPLSFIRKVLGTMGYVNFIKRTKRLNESI